MAIGFRLGMMCFMFSLSVLAVHKASGQGDARERPIGPSSLEKIRFENEKPPDLKRNSYGNGTFTARHFGNGSCSIGATFLAKKDGISFSTSFKIQKGDVIAMLGGVFRADDDPLGEALLVRIPDGDVPKGAKVPKSDSITVPLKGSTGLAKAEPAGIYLLDVKASDEGTASASLRITLGIQKKPKSLGVPETLYATVIPGEYLLLRDRAHKVREIVAPDKQTRVVGWIELSPEPIPEADLIRDKKAFVRPMPKEQGKKEARSSFADTMKNLSTDLAMGTDDPFRAYAKEYDLAANFTAPKGLRAFLLISEIEQDKAGFKGFHLGFRCDKGKISLTWSGGFSIVGDHSEASKILLSGVKRTGLTASEGKRSTFTRKIGDATEERLVIGFSQNDGGKRAACRGNYHWSASCDYSGKAPTLNELLKAMPSLQPVHREDALFDRLKDEPAYAFSTSLSQKRPLLGWQITTAATVRDDIIKALNAKGFAPGRTIKLPEFENGPAEQKNWQRLSDWTHASIISFTNDQERIGVICQPPQKPLDK